MASQFIIDGYNLDVFNVKVSAVEGLDIVPKVKERTKHSWPDESGVAVDTSTDITYEAVTFSLKCRIKDSSYKDAVKRFNGLVALLSGDGYHLLGSITRGKLYPVVLDEVSGYKQLTATSANPVWIEFTLKLLCPLPECRMGSATVTASGAVSLNANTGKQVTVWWGDGTTSTGTGALNHTYTNAGTYTVLIAGTGVTKSVFTTTVITIDEYSYPASGDVQNVDVSHTSEETWNALQAHLANLSPEYSDPQITTLKSVADGGIIPTAEATWLGATAKSVLSYLQKLVSKVFSIDGRVAKLEPILIANWTAVSNISKLTLTTYADGSLLNLIEGDVVSIEVYGKFPSVSPVYVYLNGNSTLGQYQGSGISLVGINYVAAAFTRASILINFFSPQILATVSFTRSTGGGGGINSSSNNVVTRSTEDGGNISLPVTMIELGGTFLPGSHIVVKKIR